MYAKTESMKKLHIYCYLKAMEMITNYKKVKKKGTVAIVSIVSSSRNTFNKYFKKIMVNTFYFYLSINLGLILCLFHFS